MEEGSCAPHEICVNDMPLQQTDPGIVATCVDMNNFLPGPPDPRQTAVTAAGRLDAQNPQSTTTAHQGTSGGNQDGSPGENEAEDDFEDLMGWLVDRGIQGRRASVIVSGGNGTTPLGLQSLEVDTGAGSVSNAGGAGAGAGKVQQQTCKDCFGLRTKKAAPDADFLSTKATLMASTAITGLVWITVFSG